MSNGLLGDSRALTVSRAISEFQAGRPVLIGHDGEWTLALLVEGITDSRLSELIATSAARDLSLIVSARRAAALGYKTAIFEGAVALDLSEGVPAGRILDLSAETGVVFTGKMACADATATVGVALAKLSKGVPAVLTMRCQADAIDSAILRIEALAIEGFRDSVIDSLQLSGRARVPLDGGIQAEFVVFRDMLGENAVAIIIGDPDFSRPVQVRLHSACLTGDVFGSRRCDCGDQLGLAIEQLRRQTGGVVLYLPQEGRGVGLSNKMRTYRLQDQGLDTVDANTTLGFDDDERDYGIAARMLEILGCRRILLLTNNPSKLEGLRLAGTEIVGSIPPRSSSQP